MAAIADLVELVREVRGLLTDATQADAEARIVELEQWRADVESVWPQIVEGQDNGNTA